MNPFKDWTVEQQCFGKIARRASGEPTFSTDPKACQWCAMGRVFRADLPEGVLADFDRFLLKRHSAQIAKINDVLRWTPAQFAAAWDQFEAERTQ